MRVLHIYRTYFPDTQGGLEEAIRQICLSTTSQGVEPAIYTLSTDPAPPELRRPEARVWRSKRVFEVASCGFSGAAGIRDFRRLVREADIVHYHFPWPYADLLHLLARVEAPSVVTYHSDIIRQQGLLRLYRPLMRRFLGAAHRLVATSPNYLASSPVLAGQRHKVSVIPLGLDPDSYPNDASIGAGTRFQAAVGRDYFLFIGVLRYYKGLHVLLEAARRAPECSIVIAGSGPEAPVLRHQARGLANVRFLGQVDDREKMALIRGARAVVLPSHLRSEAFGLSLLEGAMLGRPLVSCELGTGTSYVNHHGGTGLVVPPGDPVALADALMALMADPVAAERMGRAARERFEELFTAKRMGERYAALYCELLDPGKTAAGAPPDS